MPRAFIALDLPDSACERLREIAADLRGAGWVPVEHYHLTLRFLGEVERHAFEALGRALQGVRAEAFQFDLKGVGHFPLRGHPETLWAGVAPCEPLQRLRHRVESALVRSGLPPEGRKFHPHVALGRMKNGPPRLAAVFEVAHALFRIADIPAEYFHLYTSRLKPSGAEHAVEASYPLEGIPEE